MDRELAPSWAPPRERVYPSLKLPNVTAPRDAPTAPTPSPLRPLRPGLLLLPLKQLWAPSWASQWQDWLLLLPPKLPPLPPPLLLLPR